MKTLVAYICVFLIIFACSWWLLRPGMFYIHDYLHAARISEMATTLKDGHIPARWSQHFGYGHGMPLFEFYAPLPYYVGALFFMIGLPIVLVIKLLFFLCNTGTAVGGYLLGRSLFGRVGGILTAATITLAPYRAVDLYIRGALSESWGIMAIVWILYTTYLLIKDKKGGWVGLVLSVTFLLLSHNVLSILFLPFGVMTTIGFVVYQALRESKHHWFYSASKRLLTVATAYIVALGVSSFYVIPAYFEKEFTQVEQTITGGYFDYSLHFLYLRQFVTPYWGYGGSNWGPDDDISFFLGAGQILAIVLSLLFLLREGVKLYNQSLLKVEQARFWLFCIIAVLMMMSLYLTAGRSEWLWQSVTVLKFAQFPWRFLSVSIVYIGVLAPVFLFGLRLFLTRWFVAWLVFLVLLGNGYYFRPEYQLDRTDEYFFTDPDRISSELSEVLPDYLPVGFSLGELVASPSCDSCEAIEEVTQKTHYKKYVVTAAEATKLTVPSLYFPGWYVLINGEETAIDQNSLDISVPLPSGDSTVELIFGSTPLRKYADYVSAFSFVVLGCIWLYSHRQKEYVKNTLT